MSAIDWATVKNALHAWFVAGSGLAAERVVFAGQNIARPAGDGAYIALRMRTIAAIGNDWSDEVPNPLVITPLSFVAAAVNVSTSVITKVAHGRSTGDGPFRITGGTLGDIPAGDVWIIKLSVDTFKVAGSFRLAYAGTALAISDAGTGTHLLSSTTASLAAGAEIKYKSRGNRRAVLEATCFPPAEVADATEAHAILTDVVAAAGLPSRARALSAAGIGVSNLGIIQQIDGVVNSTRFEPRALFTVVFFLASEVSETGTIIETVNITEAGVSKTVDLS